MIDLHNIKLTCAHSISMTGGKLTTTLNMIFSVTYYLELRKCYIYLLHISSFINKCQIGTLNR